MRSLEAAHGPSTGNEIDRPTGVAQRHAAPTWTELAHRGPADRTRPWETTMLDPDAYVILGLKASAWLVLAVTLVAAALRGPIMLLGIPSWLFYLAMARVMERQWRFAKDLEATLADLRTRQAA